MTDHEQAQRALVAALNNCGFERQEPWLFVLPGTHPAIDTIMPDGYTVSVVMTMEMATKLMPILRVAALSSQKGGEMEKSEPPVIWPPVP